MNDREKLIDILESAESAVYWNSDDCGFIEKIADHLIANGVTVQQWEQGMCLPPREKIGALADVLHIPIETLLPSSSEDK